MDGLSGPSFFALYLHHPHLLMTFETRNQIIIDGLHPSMRYKLIHLLELLRPIGEDILFTSGTRTISVHDALYAKGRTTGGSIVTNAKGGSSFHNYGLAIDFCPVGPLGFALRGALEWTAYARYERVAKLAKSIGLESGMDWPQKDRPHLQLSECTLAQLKKGQRPDSLKARYELIAYYQRKIDNARRAMPKAALDRKIDLQKFITKNQVKISEL